MKRNLLFFFTFTSKVVFGQNLVPNASFEDINVCSELQAKCSPSAWFSVSKWGLRGYEGTRMPTISGDKHLEILVADNGNANRGYWQTMLLCPIEAGKTYSISLKVAAEIIGPNMNDIGFFFLDSLIFSDKDTLLHPKNYFTFLNGRYKKLKEGWFGVEKEFEATQSGKILIVGNFASKTNKQIFKERRLRAERLYIGIDDVEITSKDKGFCTEANEVKNAIYLIRERHSNLRLFDLVDTLDNSVVKETVDTLIINNIEFDFNSYNLKNKDSLKNLSTYCNATLIKKIKILGYTDNYGTETYNKDLSFKRANAIALYIKGSVGFKGPIEVEGLGISKKYNNDEQNRRVEIYFYK